MSVQAAGSSDSEFGYICRRCSRCCRDKRIQLNPYELARLARAKHQSTSEFRAAWTLQGKGTVLSQRDDGTCVFLGPHGCEVHADRPLVCRLYPLARHVLPDGAESFTILEGHPQSEGEFTAGSTVAHYLETQGAGPFMHAADAYFRWLCDAFKRLGLACDAVSFNEQKVRSYPDLLDMDGMIL